MKRFVALVLGILIALSAFGGAWAYEYWDTSYPAYEVKAKGSAAYVYMYSKASSSGNPIAKYYNGTILRVVDYNASSRYALCVGPDGAEGYVSKSSLIEVSAYSYEDETLEEYRVIADQRYVYIFAEPSESGESVGQYKKGDILKLIDYDLSDNFAYVIGSDNAVGYIRKNLIMKVYDYYSPLYESYRVTSTYATGYLYMYPTPSTAGTPIARYDNGTILKAVDYYISDSFCLCVAEDGNAGYVAKNQLSLESDSGSLGPIFEVFSKRYYCYMYAKPNSGSANLGRYDNGDLIEIIDWASDDNYAFVRGVKDDKYGYIQKASLHPSSVSPVKGYMKLLSPTASYAYLYEKASDGSNNLGRYENGSQIGILDWAASELYALVLAPDGKIGYIKKSCLTSLFS